jgi:hypothetical protein
MGEDLMGEDLMGEDLMGEDLMGCEDSGSYLGRFIIAIDFGGQGSKPKRKAKSHNVSPS